MTWPTTSNRDSETGSGESWPPPEWNAIALLGDAAKAPRFARAHVARRRRRHQDPMTGFPDCCNVALPL
jgi:hypothetical protein